MAPRYSIIPGDFAEDSRADVSHFRVLNLIGRHTNENGWCRLKQITIGEAVGLSRKTVNLKIKDLVEWGYVEKFDEDSTGRAIWYRTVMDRGAPPAAVSCDESSEPEAGKPANDLHPEHGSESGPVTTALQVPCNQKVTPGVTPGSDSRCYATPLHQNDPSLTPPFNDPPPSPARGGREGGKKIDEVDRTLRALVDEQPGDKLRRFAIENVLRPIVVSRKLDAASFEHGLRSLANWIAARNLNAAEAVRVVERILEARRSTVKPADIEDEVKAAIGCRPQRAELIGDGDLMARWPNVIAILTAQLGAEKVSAWFSTVVVLGVSSVRVDLATHLPHIAKFVDQEFSAQLRLALANVYGVSAFNLIARKAAA